MSVFTNPASRSIEHAKAYTVAVLDLLGARNPMHVLQATPLALRTVLAGLSGGQMAEPEARGKWSIRHVVQHLADSELVWGYRLRKALSEDRPPLTGYDKICGPSDFAMTRRAWRTHLMTLVFFVVPIFGY